MSCKWGSTRTGQVIKSRTRFSYFENSIENLGERHLRNKQISRGAREAGKAVQVKESDFSVQWVHRVAMMGAHETHRLCRFYSVRGGV